MNTPHGLLRTKYRSNWQETESASGTWLSLILDPMGIFNGTAKHLKTAADTDERNAGFTESAELPGKPSTVKPF
jgi:hypothetical protein